MQKDLFRDIIESAIKDEIEAAHFYATVADKVENAFLKELFTTFSQEEQKHRRLLETFRDDPSMGIGFEKNSRFQCL